jgi:hypothetical protein
MVCTWLQPKKIPPNCSMAMMLKMKSTMTSQMMSAKIAFIEAPSPIHTYVCYIFYTYIHVYVFVCVCVCVCVCVTIFLYT